MFIEILCSQVDHHCWPICAGHLLRGQCASGQYQAIKPSQSLLYVLAAGVLVGAVMYTYNDMFFSQKGYLWVGLWYMLCVVDSVIMKHVADTVPMTTWSRTYYNVSNNLRIATTKCCS